MDLETRQRALSKQADEYGERSTELNKVLDQVKSGLLITWSFCYVVSSLFRVIFLLLLSKLDSTMWLKLTGSKA